MKSKHPIIDNLIVLFCIIITFTTLLFYGFIREGAALIILILIIPLYYYIGCTNSLLSTSSFMIITLILNLILSITGIMETVYYGPNIRLEVFDFELGLPAYIPNARLKMVQKVGDLKAIDMKADCDVESRDIEFNTDSFGFRNDADYYRQKYLVVGDSFVVGIGNTQKDMLSSQLKQQYGLDMYSLSHPADIPGYCRYISAFKRKYGDKFQAFMFVFEGNDFPKKYTVKKKKKSIASVIGRQLKDLVSRYRSLITRTELYRLTYIKYEIFIGRHKLKNKIFVENIHGHKIAFYNEYKELAAREVYNGGEDIENAIADVKDNIGCIFFIPTKYRIYCNIDGYRKPSFNVQWEFINNISKKYHIPCINLTDALIREAKKRLFEENKLIWWADDSHWNRYGIAVGARAVYEVVKLREAKAREAAPRKVSATP